MGNFAAMARSISSHLMMLVAVYGVSLAIAWAIVVPDRLTLALIVAPPLIWLSLADLERTEIPDAATLVVALSGATDLLLRHGLTLPFFVEVVVAASLTLGLWTLGGLYYRRTGDEALGIGDAKLFGAGALCLGTSGVWQMVFLAATGGIVAALLLQRRGIGQRGIAFGPFLAYAIFILLIHPIDVSYTQ
jgi:prepilin signal peptidase PulO-like enzyme (type II secretory pathway)